MGFPSILKSGVRVVVLRVCLEIQHFKSPCTMGLVAIFELEPNCISTEITALYQQGCESANRD
jgi:hypothetical protein